jgi:hypothetical protein
LWYVILTCSSAVSHTEFWSWLVRRNGAGIGKLFYRLGFWNVEEFDSD